MSAAQTGLFLLRHGGDAGEVFKTGSRHIVRRHRCVQLRVQGGNLLEAIVLLRPRVGVQAACNLAELVLDNIQNGGMHKNTSSLGDCIHIIEYY